MRLALVSLHTSPLAAPGSGDAGGMNVVLVGLADALTAAGVEVELVTRAESPDAVGTVAETAGGTPVRRLAAGPVGAVPKSELLPLTGEFAAAFAGLPRYDLVHANYWLSGLATLPVAREQGIPHVQSLHTVAAMKNERLAPGDSPEPLARLEGERMLVHESALTLAHTAAERSSILHHYAADPARVAVVPPGVDTTLFHPATTADPDGVFAPQRNWVESDGGVDGRLHRDRRGAEPFVLVLARIQPLKGIDLALRALAEVPAAVRPRLVVAGGVSPGHEPYAGTLRELAAELGIAERVEFLDAQPRAAAAQLLREASVLLVPSYSETFGLVALEAAASGTPVLAARSTGLTDSVADGVSGLLLDSRNPGVWAHALGALLADAPRLASLSASAAAFGAQRSWAAVAAETAAHYERLLSSGSGRHGSSSTATATATAARDLFGDRPVFLHAHPDDEAISTGGTIAALVDAGAHVTLLTGTRGERGEVVPGPLAHLEGTAALAPHREAELAAALAALAPAGSVGSLRHSFLGSAAEPPRVYADSGMRWGDDGLATAASDAPADALSLAPLQEVVDDVLTSIRTLGEPEREQGPTAVISYDAIGGYGHPDHVRMHDAAAETAAILDVPFYAIVEPRVDQSDNDADKHTLELPLARRDLHRKTAAMAAHATQLTIDAATGEFVLSGGQRHPVGVTERFRREPRG